MTIQRPSFPTFSFSRFPSFSLLKYIMGIARLGRGNRGKGSRNWRSRRRGRGLYFIKGDITWVDQFERKPRGKARGKARGWNSLDYLVGKGGFEERLVITRLWLLRGCLGFQVD